MVTFATEFPVANGATRADFVAHVIAWLRGSKYSAVLEGIAAADFENESASLITPSGEELQMRELIGSDGLQAVGFRHDFPDSDGRLWRTEAVLSLRSEKQDHGILRLRTQCLARRAGARLEVPKKPYILKALLKDKMGGSDGDFIIQDRPIKLNQDTISLIIAENIFNGTATNYLPVIYISSVAKGRWIASAKEVEDLAYQLGGVAHVVVEPDRVFSLNLRARIEGRNAYGGAIAISVPGRGVIRRLLLGWDLRSVRDLLDVVLRVTVAARSLMPARGWEWTALQEQILRRYREQNRNRLSTKENEDLYRQEIENLSEQITQLKQQLSERVIGADAEADRDDGRIITKNFADQIGGEIYVDEIADRVRLAIRIALEKADQIGLDERSRALFGRFLDIQCQSSALKDLLTEIKRVTKDPRRLSSELTALLERHGYEHKSENKHIRLEPRAGFVGLGSITIPKTPSDHRGVTNLRKQVEGTLGLTRLSD